ncbi:hypothetical protein BGZ76_002015 [Entomortierella beljakovae]|nr:hypothetical protein BGZ76_002015 [Entomortierella beljakovae]
MVLQTSATRLLSLTNASKLAKTSPFRTIVTNSSVKEVFTRSSGLFNANNSTKLESLAARHNLLEAFSKHQKGLKFFSTQPLLQPHGSVKVASGSFAFQRQAVRGFSHQRSILTRSSSKEFTFAKAIRQQSQRSYSRYPSPRRRPIRFILKLMVVSSALVALPAIIIFGAPVASIFVIPLAVGGIVGGAFLLAGGILFLVIPIVTVGGALVFWFCAMPAAVTAGDLNKIIKRSKNKESSSPKSALEALGSEWEIQSSRSDEWFRWTFPTKDNELDKISIRMAVFDPNDKSERKRSTLRWMNSFGESEKYDKNGIKSEKGKIQFNNNSERLSVNNMIVKREDDHILIDIEDDGAKLLSQKWSKKYLELARLVDLAATELESRSGSKLGNQVVLARKDNHDSFWNKFSLWGDISPRIPFDRTWIHDVLDE